MMALLVSGCDYWYGEKRLDFKTVHMGFNGPDIGRDSYYQMETIATYTDAASTQNSWLKTALSAEALKKIIDETDFNQQFLLIYMGTPISILNTLEIASIGYQPAESVNERIGLDVFTYRNIPSETASANEVETYPFTIARVRKPKEPNAGFYSGGSYFEQNRPSKLNNPQNGIARTFEEVKNDGAKLKTIEILYLGLEQCLTLRKQAPKFCSELEIKHMQKNIYLAIAHYDESTPTLENILKENLKMQQDLGKEIPEILDEKYQKEFALKIQQAIALRAEILKKVVENKRKITNENP